ncbi:MAG: DUF444 family protein [Betaproteobacteria bacterium]|nr:MAG: DUF444 family protein [Betaproteobacteria bacterium]
MTERPSRITAETPWYDLFSRGARDWLRHNQKVRETVKSRLPELLAGGDLITHPENRTVLVPVRFLEHARFRLADGSARSGAGQGKGDPGQVLRPAPGRDERRAGAPGSEAGEVRFVLELKIDEIVEWLWQELKLPNLKPRRSATLDEPDYVREGWDKRGARARLDRRRTVKEAVKRRAMQEAPLAFTNEDLRFRQLVRRATPAINAAVIFALDVSGSMQEAQRRLAKTFFFFALQGLRRQYAKVETVFLAHTVEAWEFPEEQFFQVTGDGGTAASSAFRIAEDLLAKRYDPSRYNAYLFYASDGENAPDDRALAAQSIAALAAELNFVGYVETGGAAYASRVTQMAELFAALKDKDLPVGAAQLDSLEDVWNAIRAFFREQGAAAA